MSDDLVPPDRRAFRKNPGTVNLTVPVSRALKTALELEAWESQKTLAQYVRGLLEHRGKWARSVGAGGGYDLMAPLPPRADRE